MNTLSWYVHRLRSMSVAEIGWRVGRAVRDRAVAAGVPVRDPARLDEAQWSQMYRRFRAGSGRPVLLDRTRARQIAVDHPELVAAMISAADAAAAGEFEYFGYPRARLVDPIDWNHDPVAGITWPSLPASRIDHRTADGDVKWIWELNRLQHLPWLAQAWLFTGDDRYANAAFDHLDGWLAQNPPGQGIAWRGAFEAGVRAISVSVAMQGLRDADALTADRFRAVTTMLAESARRCWADRSLFSSANNHLIGELAGLSTVAVLFPELPDAAAWERDALAALTRHGAEQILPDGAGAEQAVAYQMFTVELLLVVARLLTLRDGAAPDGLTQVIRRSSTYLADLVGPGEPTPHYGDDDEGFALRLGPEPLRSVPDHLAIVAATLPTAAPAAIAARAAAPGGDGSLCAEWFRDTGATTITSVESARSTPDTVPGAAPGSFFAPDGGLVVLRSGGRRITMDVGPLGFGSIAAHGHADALAITVSHDGYEHITDPGAGSYYGKPDLRRTHRGTRAHATVTVDGADQSVIGGPFMWNTDAHTTIRSVDLDRGIVDAEHDGYARLPEPVTHRRWLIAPPDRPEILVVDLITSPTDQDSADHDIVVSWPLPPHFTTKRSAGGFDAIPTEGSAASGWRLRYATTGEDHHDVVTGDATSHLGWWSERLEHVVPAPLIGIHASGATPLGCATLITPTPGDDLHKHVKIEIYETNIAVDWFSGGTIHKVVIDIVHDGIVRFG